RVAAAGPHLLRRFRAGTRARRGAPLHAGARRTPPARAACCDGTGDRGALPAADGQSFTTARPGRAPGPPHPPQSTSSSSSTSTSARVDTRLYNSAGPPNGENAWYRTRGDHEGDGHMTRLRGSTQSTSGSHRSAIRIWRSEEHTTELQSR